MSPARLGLLVLLTLQTTACYGDLLSKTEIANSPLISAAPLCEDVPKGISKEDKRCTGEENPPDQAGEKGSPNPNKQYLAKVVNESQYLCGRFVNALVISSVGVHGDLDILTTVFSALGTAFTPIATVHALTAAASISSGWKSAIDSDLYAQATIANYAEVIQSTYYVDMNKYVKQLEKIPDAEIIPEIELTKIRPIHKECSLASAQASIHASLEPPVDASKMASTIITVSSVKAKDTFALTGTSTAPKLSIATRSITATAKDTTGSIADKLLLALEDSSDFRQSGMVPTPSGAAITIKGGDSVVWKSTGTGTLDIKTTPGTDSSGCPITGTTTSSTPGHSVQAKCP